MALPAQAQTGQFDLEKTKIILTETIERVIKERGVPSISIALGKGDSIVWKAAFGFTNVRTKTPATPETIYSTGSTFKSATATALMQLHEQGKFGLDDPVNRYLGGTQIKDKREKPVTFRHMLSHWSGLNAGAATKPIWGRELPRTLEQMVSELHAVRAPEEKYEYNNFAYGMAGLLVERISGKPYAEYMMANVLEPLGITTASPVSPSPEMVELMALPYARTGSDGQFKPVPQVHFDVYPAGDVYLTAEDMARFLGAHLNGGSFQGKRILSAASVKAMQQPQFGGEYGFGLGVRKDATGHTIIRHNGAIPGQSSLMLGDVDARVGVYVMSNSGAPAAIAEIAVKLLRGESYPAAPTPTSSDTPRLEQYAGVYDMEGNVTFTIARQGSGLTIQQGASADKLELIPESGTRFTVKGQPVTLTFVTDASGAISRIVVETPRYKREAKRRMRYERNE